MGMQTIEQIWLAIGIHLWQSTLVLLVMFAVGWTLRSAPATVRNRLWWLALAKLFLPLSVFEWFGRQTILPAIEVLGTGTETGLVSAIWGRTSALLNPSPLMTGGHAVVQVLLVVLSLSWLMGAVWLGSRWIRSPAPWHHRGISLDDAASHVRDRLASALGGTAIPCDKMRVSQDSTMPAVFGLFAPKILVPQRLMGELSVSELRGILLHEDAHRRRFDPLRDMVRRVAIFFFFYYPLLWPVLRRLQSTRELACDEAALRNGVAPSIYGGALARTLKLGLRLSGLPAAGGQGDSSLVQRLRHLDRHGRLRTMLKHRLALVCCVLLVAAGSFFPLSPLAENKDDEVTIGKVTHRVMPDYPDSARKAGIEGMVRLRVTVKEDGGIGDITVEKGVKEAPSLAESAIEAMRQWKFEPPTKKNGEPAEMTIIVPFQFKLDDDKAKDEKTSSDKPKDPPEKK